MSTNIMVIFAAMVGAIALILACATWQIQRIESQYQTLQQTQAAAVHDLDMLRQHLNDASSLIHQALNNPDQSFRTKEQLQQLQHAFEAQTQNLQSLTRAKLPVLYVVSTQTGLFFEAGRQAIDANLQRHMGRPVYIGTEKLSVATEQLRQELKHLRQQTNSFFALAFQDLLVQTQLTRSATWASWICVVLIFAYVAWRNLRTISHSLRRFAHSMQGLAQQDYSVSITEQERTDEIGHLGRSLHALKTALQRQGLQQQHEHLLLEQVQHLIGALPGTVFQLQVLADNTWKLRFVSPQWVQLMGQAQHKDTSAEAATQFFRNADPQTMASVKQHFLDSAQTLQPVNFDWALQVHDGETCWIKTHANPHAEADGSIVFTGIWQDVTNEVAQAQALSQAKSQAEQNIAERTAMQAAISHEIRTPLNAILGLTQLLLKADLPVSQREQLHHILRAGQHLLGIVNEVLDFSKIDAGQLKLESTDFSLETVVLDVIGMCQKEASKKGLTLHYKISRTVPDSLRGDPHRIAQILLNYVNNAIKFTSTGRIDIALNLDPSSSQGRIVLHASVKDTGAGIPEDRIPFLFKAYQQADQSITRRFGGTGLGLAISSALAQLMGGAVGVQSVVGAGSNFWFTAVLEPARSIVQHSPYSQPAVHAEAVNWEGLRILVVDDNPLNRAVAEGMLHALGLQTDVAEDGAQALLKLQSCGPQYFSCVLMDIQMPHMDGLSATKALRQLPGFEKIPVIAMTAHTAVEDAERSLAAGMNAHLSKPLLEPALHAVLQKWLGASTLPTPFTDSQHYSETAEAIPPIFDASAMDALAQLFAASKLQQLIEQFATDTLQRTARLQQLAQQQQWQDMRGEAHKLTGTAATFGLTQLGHWSSELSAALKAPDAEQIISLTARVGAAAEAGIQALQDYAKS